MTAENESGDQGDAHERALPQQRQPGTTRNLSLGLSIAAFAGNGGTKQAAIGVASSAVALSQMLPGQKRARNERSRAHAPHPPVFKSCRILLWSSMGE